MLSLTHVNSGASWHGYDASERPASAILRNLVIALRKRPWSLQTVRRSLYNPIALLNNVVDYSSLRYQYLQTLEPSEYRAKNKPDTGFEVVLEEGSMRVVQDYLVRTLCLGRNCVISS